MSKILLTDADVRFEKIAEFNDKEDGVRRVFLINGEEGLTKVASAQVAILPDIYHYMVQNPNTDPNIRRVVNIALGAHESIGFNKRKDVWFEDDLLKTHNYDKLGPLPLFKTFEHYARFYREHKNKTGDPYYGSIEFAAYNPSMARLELVMDIDSRLDPETAQAIDDGRYIATSMGFDASADQCSECGNIRKDLKGSCMHLLPNNIGRTFPNGNVWYAINNQGGRFFDNSRVLRPAEPIAAIVINTQKADISNFVPDGAAAIAAMPKEASIQGPVIGGVAFRKAAGTMDKESAIEKENNIMKEIESTMVPAPNNPVTEAIRKHEFTFYDIHELSSVESSASDIAYLFSIIGITLSPLEYQTLVLMKAARRAEEDKQGKDSGMIEALARYLYNDKIDFNQFNDLPKVASIPFSNEPDVMRIARSVSKAKTVMSKLASKSIRTSVLKKIAEDHPGQVPNGNIMDGISPLQGTGLPGTSIYQPSMRMNPALFAAIYQTTGNGRQPMSLESLNSRYLPHEAMAHAQPRENIGTHKTPSKLSEFTKSFLKSMALLSAGYLGIKTLAGAYPNSRVLESIAGFGFAPVVGAGLGYSFAKSASVNPVIMRNISDLENESGKCLTTIPMPKFASASEDDRDCFEYFIESK